MLDLNRVYLLDCMEGMADIPDKYFELAIVDPPYALKRLSARFAEKDKIFIDGKIAKWNTAPTAKYFDALFRISSSQIIWGANNFQLPPSEYFCIWDKKQSVDNFACAEYAWVSANMKKPAKIFRYSIHKCMADRKAMGGKIHPTQKPIDLYKWLLANYAKEGDKILDTHVGSGSSIIACIDMGFEYMGFEIDADYHKAMTDRIYHFTRQETLFDNRILPYPMG